MSHFSRAQQGVMLLLGMALLILWGWRGGFGRAPGPASAPGPGPVFVEVVGEVARSGVYAFSQPPTPAEVWRQAGGSRPVPAEAAAIPSGSRVEISPGRYHLSRMSAPQLLTLGLALDLNQAGQVDLEALPGIGPSLAKRIVAYRDRHGPFQKVEDLEKVSGLGPKKLAQIRPYLLSPESAELPPPIPEE